MKIHLFSALCLSALVACSSSADGECESASYQCDGTVLQQCGDDGMWADKEDCADMNMMCHAEMGHCMAVEDTGMSMSDSGMGE